MLTRELIKSIHRKYAGDNKYPAEGTDKWAFYLETANDFKNEWATDPDNRWNSCFREDRRFGIMTSSRTYSLGGTVHDLSDSIFVDTLGGQTIEFAVIKKRDRYKHRQAVFVTGDNPKNMTFVGEITANLIGGSIRGGCYIIPDNMKSPSGTVPVDRPSWLAYRSAAELAAGDPAKDDKFPDLLGLANDEYWKMSVANVSLPENQVDEVAVEGFDNLTESY